MDKEIKKIIDKNQYRSKFYSEYRNTPKAPKKIIEKKVKPKILYTIFNRVLISTFLLFLLLISKHDERLNEVYHMVFKPMNFMKIDQFITVNLNGLFPKTTDPTQYVNANVISLENTSTYEDGVLVQTDPYEAILSHADGIVIRIDNDETLGKLIVIQDVRGYLYSYGDLAAIEVSLFSRVDYGEVLGIGQITDEYDGEFYLAITDSTGHPLNVLSVVNDEN